VMDGGGARTVGPGGTRTQGGRVSGTFAVPQRNDR
jgi:hypothetical protein